MAECSGKMKWQKGFSQGTAAGMDSRCRFRRIMPLNNLRLIGQITPATSSCIHVWRAPIARPHDFCHISAKPSLFFPFLPSRTSPEQEHYDAIVQTGCV